MPNNLSANNQLATMWVLVFICLFMTSNEVLAAKPDDCQQANISVQVLGSGGPELMADRASSSYLIWQNDKAIIMLDSGAGSALRFAQSRAQWSDLKVLLFSHLHADHSNDLPALIKASWFGNRNQDLPVFGPFGNHIMPSTTAFINGLFNDSTGVYRYLSDFYQSQASSSYLVKPHDLANTMKGQVIFTSPHLKIIAQQVKHGPIPTFAYIINICDKTVIFSGDTNGKGLKNISSDKTDLFIAHNAIAENAGPIAQSLHMTPQIIGETAAHLNTLQLILSHRMQRSLGKEQDSETYIRKNYTGPLIFANDMDKFLLR